MFKKLQNKSVFGLIGVQLFAKSTGILREIILANFFGPAQIFSDYLKLMTIGQLVSFFCSESGLTANFMKKFSIMKKRNLSFNRIRSQSKRLSFAVALIVFIFQMGYYFSVIPPNNVFWLVMIVSSIASGLVLHVNIGQIILLSHSNYISYNKSNLYRASIYFFALVPLINLFSILGAELNRLISVFSQYWNTWKTIRQKYNVQDSNSLALSLKDFNIWVFFSNNLLFVWFILFRLFFSFDQSNEIIYFTYAFILASGFDGILLKPFASFVLEKKVNSKLNSRRIIIYLSFLALGIILLSYLIAFEVINWVFGFTGKFSHADVLSIFVYFMFSLLLVFSNGIYNIILQNSFSRRRVTRAVIAKKYLLTSLGVVFFIFIFSKIFDLNMIYVMLNSVLLSLLNFYFIVSAFVKNN